MEAQNDAKPAKTPAGIIQGHLPPRCRAFDTTGGPVAA